MWTKGHSGRGQNLGKDVILSSCLTIVAFILLYLKSRQFYAFFDGINSCAKEKLNNFRHDNTMYYRI